MNVIENRIYFTYMVLGSLYFIFKLICYILRWVCLPGLMLGLVASVLTILIGIASFKEYKKAGKPITHWLTALGPLIIILYSPFHMTMRLEIPVFRLSNGRKGKFHPDWMLPDGTLDERLQKEVKYEGYHYL